MYDLTALLTASVLGIPLVAVVLGLVTYYGKWGVKGKAQLGASMGTGLVLGMGYQVSVLGVPTNYAGWFSIGIYGIALGLVASGVYEFTKDTITKVMQHNQVRFGKDN